MLSKLKDTGYRRLLRKALLAQCVVLIVWLIISVMQWMLWPSNVGIKIPVLIRGTEALSVFLLGLVYITIFESVNFKSDQFNWKLGLIVILAVYFGSVLSNLLSILIKELLGYKSPYMFLKDKFLLRSTWFFIPFILNVGVFVFFKIEYIALLEKAKNIEAQTYAQQAKWMMLRYQINPHFLFNALNSIRALIGVNDVDARRIVTEMSDYFRYSLSSEDKYTITVAEEIKAVLNYLKIQKIRFQEKIIYEIDIHKNAENCLIPIFSIQTLVENAIKYGLKTTNDNLKIVIECSYLNGNLDIQVKNSGFIISQDKNNSTHKGILNLKNRLNHLYPNKNSFSLFEKNGYVIAHILLKDCRK